VSEPVVCAALRVEARAIRAGWPQARTQVIGMRAKRLRGRRFDGPVVLLGFGGGVRAGQRPGDVVVASEIRTVRGRTPLPSAGRTAATLRRAGVEATVGPLWCSEAIVFGRSARAELAGRAVAVDMESAPLAAATAPRDLTVVRVLVDTPARGLARASVLNGRHARRVLRQVAAALGTAANANADRGYAANSKATDDDGLRDDRVGVRGTNEEG
jgi:4-hydroxy-3-methylbut-2-enyl diphosphate reductase